MSIGNNSSWDKVMKKYNSNALKYYKEFQDSILTDGALDKKHKHLILVGVNAARRYEPELLHHAKCAYELGAAVDEVVEVLTSCILSRGIPAWLEGIKAIELVLEDGPQHINHKDKVPNTVQNVDEAIDYFKNDNKGLIPEWVTIMQKYSPNSLVHYASLRRNELCDAVVSRKLKEMVLIGINLAERYELGIKLHVNGAKEAGATNEELAEVALLCVGTAGIPAWLEISKYLS